ncbi:MAG: hypothetical protein P8103_02500 [Candidatus Thiodiazotropha sp.]
MHIISKSTAILISLLTALVLAACGGGGGGGGVPGTNVPTAGVSITTSNAKPVSAAVLDSVDTVEGSTAGVGILTGVSVVSTTDGFNYPDFIVSQLNKLLSQDMLVGGNLSGVAISETYNCTSGTFNVTGNIADVNTLTAGDTLTISFSNCSDSGVVINGSMSMTFTQVSAGFDGFAPFTLGINVVMTNFSVNDSGYVISTNGDMSMLLSVDASGNESMQLSGSSLSSSAGGEAELLTNYAYDMMYSSAGAYSVTLQGTLASTKIDGSVSYTTITPFTGNDYVGSGNPTGGELHITTSADSSQAWLIAQPDGVNVQIDIDTDGDNTVDETVMTTWTELQSL